MNLYSAAIASGVLVAFLFLWQRGRKRRMPDLSIFLVGLIFAAPFVFLGARLWTYASDANLNRAINQEGDFGNSILSFFGFSSNGSRFELAGLSFHGGFLAGMAYTLLFFTWYGHRYSIAVLELCDFIIPAVLLLQIFGRFGNFANQEILGDIITTNYPNELSFLPSFIAEKLSSTSDSTGSVRHPLFFYELSANLLFFCLILVLPNLVAIFSFRRQYAPRNNADVRQVLKEANISLSVRRMPAFLHWRLLTFRAYRLVIAQKTNAAWKNSTTPPAIRYAKHFYWARGPRFAADSYPHIRFLVASRPPSVGRFVKLSVLFFHRSSFNLTQWNNPFRAIILKSGTLTALYLVFYNSARFGLQFLRQSNDSMPITIPTTIVLAAFGIGLFVFAQCIFPARWRSVGIRYETQF